MSEISLNFLFNKYGCDKGSDGIKGRPPHNYNLLYEKDMSKKKNDNINILEIGILRGKSIASFLDYFPKAQIYAIDTFERIPPNQIRFINNERVHWIKADSTDTKVSDLIEKSWGDISFDFIIDDGLHTPDANTSTFKNFIKYLKDDGIYYVEDTWPLHLMTEEEIQNTESYRLLPQKLYTKNKMKKFIESLQSYNYTEHDFRNITKSFAPDSYIFRVKK